MRKYRKLAMFSVSLDAVTTEWEPVRQREIDCFVEVKLENVNIVLPIQAKRVPRG